MLDASSTKWNFLPFQPGLVGGHCIGVDPYYLTYKSQQLGYNPEVILAGRNLNDNMSTYVVEQVIQKMKDKKLNLKSSKVLIMGLTFKENCPDIRNTQISKVFSSLKNIVEEVNVFDPWVSTLVSEKQYGIKLISKPLKNYYDLILIAVKHEFFKELGLRSIRKFAKENYIIYDLKNLFDEDKLKTNI